MMYAACYKMATFPIPPLPSRNILCEILISNFFAFHYLPFNVVNSQIIEPTKNHHSPLWGC